MPTVTKGTSTATYKCKRCGDPFVARTADRKRGWARFCSKSCKAIRQTQKTGMGRDGRINLPNGGWQIGNQLFDRHGVSDGIIMSAADLSFGGYGDADTNTPFGDGKW
jgi:hypothetical protein